MTQFKSSHLMVIMPMIFIALWACAGSRHSGWPPRPISINALIIHNNTDRPVHDFLLKVDKVKKHVSVTPILGNNQFSTTFPLRTYQKNQVSITWRHDGRKWSSRGSIIEPPDDLVPGRPVTITIIIGENGQVMTTMTHTERP